MRTRIISTVTFLFVCLTSFAQTNFKVTYSLPIVQGAGDDDTSYHEHVTYDIWGNTITQMIDAASKGDIQVYDSLGAMIPSSQVHKNICTYDTLLMVNPITLQEFVKKVPNCVPLDQEIKSFSMKESWTIQENGMIAKKVSEYGLLYYSPKQRHKPAFWLHPGTVATDHQTATVQYNIDLSHFINPEDSTAFITFLKKKILSGEVNAFDPRAESHKPLTKEEIENLFKPYTSNDTLVTIDPIALTETMTVNKWIQQTTISHIKFTEDWMIDSKGNFTKYVREYCLMTRDYDNKGEFRGLIPFLMVRPKR